ncbi:MAG: hypothetical protein WBO36_15490 [Saprospiraceae bacterium]
MKTYVSLLTLLLAIFVNEVADAQFGLRLKYNNNTHANWEKAINDRYASNSTLLKSGIEAGLDYWFRLKNRRIEFLPELAYSFASNESPNASINKISYQAFHINFNTHIYALDLEGDCDCPTFSKQGPSIQKGLFFHFTPGLGYYQASISENETATPTLISNKASGLMVRLGIGLGLDLGINDFLTITPMDHIICIPMQPGPILPSMMEQQEMSPAICEHCS